MRGKFFAALLFISLLGTSASPAVDEEVSFNPRDDYIFGVGSMVGGPLGVIGLISDFNWYSLINIGMGIGSGIYYDTYMAQARYLILDHAFTPYMGAGFAYWDSIAPGTDLSRSETAVKLGMVAGDGSALKSGLLLLPLSLGVHYVSQLGLAIFADVEYLFSLSTLSGTPYGALGVQWYF